MAAALGDADTDDSDRQSALKSLLDAIWRVFHATKKVRIHTRDLVGELLAMDEGKWKEAYRGGNISEYYIRSHLKGVIPPSAEARADRRWRRGGPPYWGYHVLHLQDAWKHYLNGRGLPVEIKDMHAQAPSKTGISSDTSDTEAGNEIFQIVYPCRIACRILLESILTTPPDTAQSDTAASNTVSDTGVSDDQSLSDTASNTPFCKENQNVNGSVSDVSDEDGVLDGGRARGFPRGARGRRHRQDGDGEARQ